MEDLRPAIALNVFIEPYFRKEILQKVFENIDALPTELRRELVAEVKEKVRISGFRNSMAAPRALLIRDAEAVFEKDTRFSLICLKSWQSLYTQWDEELKKNLVELGFSISEQAAAGYPDPINTFLEGWPEGIDFDTLFEKITAQVKKFSLSKDETALLSILLTGYLL
jgi:hypothetical protein